MREALILRHMLHEDLGVFAPVLRGAGFTVHYREAVTGVEDVDPLIPELLVVLGGPAGVYQAGTFPYLDQERRLLAKRLEAGLPTLGVCLGAQLMAAALGARVYPGPQTELGWCSVELTPEGRNSALKALERHDANVFQWHGDTFDLPSGATRLAGNTLYPQQAFSWGKSALALQFHAEFDPAGLEHWLLGGISSQSEAVLRDLRAACVQHGERSAAAGRDLLAQWLDTVGLSG